MQDGVTNLFTRKAWTIIIMLTRSWFYRIISKNLGIASPIEPVTVLFLDVNLRRRGTASFYSFFFINESLQSTTCAKWRGTNINYGVRFNRLIVNRKKKRRKKTQDLQDLVSVLQVRYLLPRDVQQGSRVKFVVPSEIRGINNNQKKNLQNQQDNDLTRLLILKILIGHNCELLWCRNKMDQLLQVHQPEQN